jgi:hypothetical protein
MRRLIRLALLLAVGALSGCGLADSRSTFVPEVFRQPLPPEPQAEPPDVRGLVQADLSGLFLESAHPTNIRISPPQPGTAGLTWIACIKADVTGMSGNIINNQTLQIEISGGKIRDRRRADENGPCGRAVYEPL